jgi:hypothetical protein
MKPTNIWLVTFLFFGVFSACNKKDVVDGKEEVVSNVNGFAVVKITKTPEGYQLLRHGEPFYIKGVGGYGNFDQIKEIGGNAIRTWDTKRAQEILDIADSLGLVVMLGLGTGKQHWGTSFDYSNEQMIAAKLQEIADTVRKYKDHPALLMWNVGNELTLNQDNYDPIWMFINRMAQTVKQVDNNHPVTYSHNGIGRKQIRRMGELLTDVDAISFNIFLRLYEVLLHAPGLTNAGWDKPYIITEWGTPASWESEKTNWGAPIEMNTSQRASFFKQAYADVIAKDPYYCLGSFAFYWGEKFEATHTFFSVLPEGRQSGITEALAISWKGTPPYNKAPVIQEVYVESVKDYKNAVLKAGHQYTARIKAYDPDGDSLRFRWEIRREAPDKDIKGDYDNPIQLEGNGREVVFRVPNTLGGYRIFAYVYDDKDFIATVNLPFYALLD